MNFQLEPCSRDDAQFVYAIHCSSMRDVISRTWGWDEEWQAADFESRFEPGRTSFIVTEGQRVGFLELEDRGSELYVGTLNILPAWQNQGVGSAVMRDVLSWAASSGVPISLQVLELNFGARRFYERLGLIVVATKPPHHQMHSNPDLTRPE
jgi:ribosomal protein S18 acetylase RimI-like enzyme